ncbi:hypothetical protein BLNAU_3166 [Blattamonas nauphoetae]|uniref:Uncharacterized protein n=1 Tax=Blattamonas nauphoetae TaxID=2049346 RepID=A0ABQ9YDR3_9EUKA|nr:hypothetical protein BLNAU_3166 [Blattamonas nauphoetae]
MHSVVLYAPKFSLGPAADDENDPNDPHPVPNPVLANGSSRESDFENDAVVKAEFCGTGLGSLAVIVSEKGFSAFGDGSSEPVDPNPEFWEIELWT